MQFEFSGQILKIHSNIKFHKIRPVEAEFVSCGQTDMMNLIVAFCNFANAPKDTVVHTKGKSQLCQITITYTQTSVRIGDK
jgi:hypothetical protein